MPYGDEARDALMNLIQGKCLRVLVYEEDQYGRSVGDLYCNGVFVQVRYSLLLRTWIYVIKSDCLDLQFSGKNAQNWLCMALRLL